MTSMIKKTPKVLLSLILVLAQFSFLPFPAEAKSKKTHSDPSSPFQLVPDAHEVDSVALSNGYPPILIGPGDFLTINVYGETALATTYQVDADGDITFPYLGAVKLENLTPNEASDKLANALFKPRKVTVLISESNTYWISVIGEVTKPGKYQIKGKPTLLSTLSDGGGVASDADLSHALIIHQNMRIPVDLTKYIKGTGPMQDQPYLYPGDVLMVPKEGWLSSPNDFIALIGAMAGLAVIAIDVRTLH
jgi:protein involved in polysaccharide export with SLBB domain